MTTPLPKILAIDDTPVNLMTLGAQLQGEFELQFATSGLAGIELALLSLPDLILLDVMMPEVDGFETYKRLRAQPTLNDIPVIFVTALDNFVSEMMGLSLGAADYITKPVNVVIARQRIRNLLERERLRKEVETQRDFLRTLSVAIEQSPVSVAITNLDACLEYVNPRFTEVTGYTSAEVLGQNPRMLQSGITPKETHLAMWDMLTHGHTWKGELVNKRKNGELYWEEAQIAPVKDAHGMVTHYVAVKADITERKQAEEKLILAASVFTNSHEGITITDANGSIVDVNASFTRITGYSHAEAVGMNPNILKSGRHDQAFYASMWRDLKNKNYWSGEIWNKRKSGEVYAEMLTISTVRDAQGQVRQYVAQFSDISERKLMEDQVRQLAFYDSLTGLPNRRLLDDRLKQALVAAKRSGLFGAVIFLDLDNFKPLNDTHGHAVGDLLVEVARRLAACVREVDTVARFGGDEFVVLLGELDVSRKASMAQAGIVAEKIRASLAAPYELHVEKSADMPLSTVVHHCSASIGVVVFSSEQINPHEVLKWADMAMYQAKDAGRNAIRFHEDE
jgi:diguanylate cyclase (GGDEF)-like protein/PAS domain S-box-containing protein